jgi:hypothetical protein
MSVLGFFASKGEVKAGLQIAGHGRIYLNKFVFSFGLHYLRLKNSHFR